MPAQFQVDRRTRTVYLTLTGTFTSEDVAATIHDMFDALAGETAYNVFADHRGLTTAATAAQVRVAAELIGGPGSPFRGGRWAIVSATQASFGMMRMLAVHTEEVPVEMEVFRDVESAERWLAREL